MRAPVLGILSVTNTCFPLPLTSGLLLDAGVTKRKSGKAQADKIIALSFRQRLMANFLVPVPQALLGVQQQSSVIGVHNMCTNED